MSDGSRARDAPTWTRCTLHSRDERPGAGRVGVKGVERQPQHAARRPHPAFKSPEQQDVVTSPLLVQLQDQRRHFRGSSCGLRAGLKEMQWCSLPI